MYSPRGPFGKGEMQKEFEEVAFALEPGQVSNVVETASGVHLIERYEPDQTIRAEDATYPDRCLLGYQA